MQKYQSGGHERKPMMLKVSTSADGTYHIALMPGKYTLWIEPPWGSELPRKTIRDVQIKADMTLDIVWKGTILSGKLTDTDGNPVGNVNIEISGENSGQTQSTKDGTYRVELGPSDYPTGAVRDGIIRIHIHPPAASGLISRTIGIERVKADRTLDITLLRTQMTADGSENAHTSEEAKGEEATELITGKVVATIPLQHSLDRALITPDSRFVYVMGCHDNVVSVIDTSSNKVVKTLAAGIAFEDTEDLACYMVVTPDSRWVYVNYNQTEDISVIDTSSYEIVKRVIIGDYPGAISITPNGRFAYVPATPNRAGLDRSRNISVIEPSSNTVVKTVVMLDRITNFQE